MKQRVLLAALCAGVLAQAIALAAWERPDTYPEVTLTTKSEPRYSSVYLDTKTNQVAYLCFDGNVEKGYAKMFVWIPGERKYDPPKAIRSNNEKQFSKFGIDTTTVTDNDEINISWGMRWRIHSGKHRWFDYSKGVMVEKDVGNYPQFVFNTDFERTPRKRIRRSATQSAKLDIGIPGYLNTSPAWTNCPPPIAPWNKLNFYMTSKIEQDRAKSQVRFTGRLTYYYWWNCEVRSVAPDTEIDLVVSPYLEDPVYSNKLNAAEIFGPGVVVELQPGWYDCEWDIRNTGMKVRNRRDWLKNMYSPFPVPQPIKK
jgi:hypothetical protein